MSRRLSLREINHGYPVILRWRRNYRFRLKAMDAAMPQLGRIRGEADIASIGSFDRF